MPNVINYKQGDSLPLLQTTLINQATGTPVNLTGATVSIRLRRAEIENTWVENPASVVSGLVTYPLQPSDTQTPGDYYIEWVVNFSGAVKTYPTNDYDLLIITANLT